jgi:hypothetical protein
MADPISIGLMAVSTGITAFGAFQGAQGERELGQANYQTNMYQAGVAAINRRISLQNADYERRMGEVEAQQVGLRHGQIIGRQRAAQGASGIDVNTGTAPMLRESQHDVSRQDQRVTRANAARRAYGHEIEAMSAEHSENLYRMAGTNAVRAAENRATSSLLSGASSVASRWTSGYQTGMFGSSRGGYGANYNERGLY